MQENTPVDIADVADIYNSSEVVTSAITPNNTKRVVQRKSKINSQTKAMKSMRAMHDGHSTLNLMAKSGVIDNPFATKATVTKASTINDLFGLTNAVRTAILNISKGVLAMTGDANTSKFPSDVLSVINNSAKLVEKDGLSIIKRIETVEGSINDLSAVPDDQWNEGHYMESLSVGTEVMDIQELLDNTVVLYYSEIQAYYNAGLAALKLNATIQAPQ